ncbi:MAG: hypothetical protein LBT13_08760 [Treponema sp.]|jgi:nitrous oxidase accessory protein NosD|nr:hypothetical protein [Treponema sp.]
MRAVLRAKSKRLVSILLTCVLMGCGTTGQDKLEQCYYVKADGNDAHEGRTEATALKNLRRAIYLAKTGTIKTIMVIGTLNIASELQINVNTFGVFAITETGKEEITITGKPDASATERAVLSGSDAGKAVIAIGGDSQVRFEYIEISGGESKEIGGGIIIIENAKVTLGNGAQVRGNRSQSGGGGAAVAGNGALTISGGEISGNQAEMAGGGVYVGYGASFTQSDPSPVSGNQSPDGADVYWE